MVDSLFRFFPPGQRKTTPLHYAVLTLHRPENVDDPEKLRAILESLRALPIVFVFPIHPRTAERMKSFDITPPPNIDPTPPKSYLPFIRLLAEAKVVLTDSGGIQEETSCLGTPCLTLRGNTERPATLLATNKLVGTNPAAIRSAVLAALVPGQEKGELPKLWDGYAAQRIVESLGQNEN